MSATRSNAPHSAYQLGLRLKANCDYAAIREAAQFARNWLATQNLPEAELAAWELALVEAGNNAVKHATEKSFGLPVGLDLSVGEIWVEARITDHTAGFDMPDQVDLPDFESEGGRGLFVMKSLCDELFYLRGKCENELVLRKRRTQAVALSTPDPLALQRRLAENDAALNEMSEELASSYESLVAMFRYSAELGTNADLRDFSRRLLTDLMQLTETDAVVLRLFAVGSDRLETYLALPGDLPEKLPPVEGLSLTNSVELEAIKSREDVWFSSQQPLPAGDPLNTIPGGKLGIVHAFGPSNHPLGTVTLVRTRNEVPFRSAQVNLLHTFIDFLAIQVVNTRLLDERTQSRITRRELEIAANIQRSLLPVALPACPPFNLAASCTSAREIGGDFYDAIQVNDEGVLFIIADVMGKGVPAALFAAVLRSAVRSMPSLLSRPAALLTAVNRTLCDDLSRVDMFVTAKAVFLDVHRQCVVSASAGHCPLLIWSPGQAAAKPVNNAGLPLGIEADCEYTQAVTEFPPGGGALLYTDGVTELQDPDGQMYGNDRLAHFLPQLSARAHSADQMSRTLQTELENFRAGAPLADDQTFLIISHQP